MDGTNTLTYWSYFTSGWILTTSFGLPCILAHSNVIALGNCSKDPLPCSATSLTSVCGEASIKNKKELQKALSEDEGLFYLMLLAVFSLAASFVFYGSIVYASVSLPNQLCTRIFCVESNAAE